MPIALITGATGFIGAALVKHLHQAGWNIRALTRSLSHPCVLNNPHYHWIIGDFTELDKLPALCKDVDVVFHAAGFAHASKNGDESFWNKHRDINEIATIQLAEKAASSGVKRFVFFSSIKADNPIKQDPYACAKYAAETALLQLCENSQMEGVILRLSLVYGVGWKGNLLALLKAIDKNRMLPMPNVGNRKSMVSVQDACQAARIAATITLTEHRIFIISDGVPYSTDQIYHLMRKALGKRQISFSVPLCLWRYFGYVGDLLQRVCKINLPIHSEKIEKLFASSWYDMNDYTVLTGYVPQYTLSDVLPDIVRDYRENLCKEC